MLDRESIAEPRVDILVLPMVYDSTVYKRYEYLTNYIIIGGDFGTSTRFKGPLFY